MHVSGSTQVVSHRDVSAFNKPSFRHLASKLLQNVKRLQNPRGTKRVTATEQATSGVDSYFSAYVGLLVIDEFAAFAFFAPAERFVLHDFAYGETIVQFS